MTRILPARMPKTYIAERNDRMPAWRRQRETRECFLINECEKRNKKEGDDGVVGGGVGLGGGAWRRTSKKGTLSWDPGGGECFGGRPTQSQEPPQESGLWKPKG